jgi:two-component system LytT family response regulator
MRALVIDDERLARKELITLLNQLETVEVVGEAVNVEDAKEKITKLLLEWLQNSEVKR